MQKGGRSGPSTLLGRQLHCRPVVAVQLPPQPSAVKGGWALAVLGVLLLAGCSRGDRPSLGLVSGTVTLDGKPLAGARVIFEPVEGGRASTASTDNEGRYELIYIRTDKGAKVGPHNVRIFAGNSEQGRAEVVPARYNLQTTLRVEVKPGENERNFELTSGPQALP